MAKYKAKISDRYYRPTIDFEKISIYVSIYIDFLAFSLAVSFFFHASILMTCLIPIISSIFVLVIFGKKLSLFVINLYQHYAPDDVRDLCRFTPSCSEYAKICINKYGFIIGWYKAIKRLKRCSNPFVVGGIDLP